MPVLSARLLDYWMYTARLERIDPDDPRWGPVPARPPDVYVSVQEELSGVTRLQCSLVAYDWIVDGRAESKRPEEPFDSSGIDVLDIQGADSIHFEIQSVASPVSITVTRVFDLCANNPTDFESIAELLTPSRSEPAGLVLTRVEDTHEPYWLLDVPIASTQEESHVTIQTFWSESETALTSEYMASWILGLSGCPDGQTRAERVELREHRRDESGPQRPEVGDGGPIQWNGHSDKVDLDETTTAILRSPLGRAFATIAAGSEIDVDELVQPEVCIWLCTEASDDIEIWRADRDRTLAFLEHEAPRHEDFLRDILSRPSVSWWFEPLARASQIWLSGDGTPPSEELLITPTSKPTKWERYALKPAGGLFTSTHMGEISHMVAAIDYGVGDLRPGFGKPPYQIWRMDVDESARIFEVHGPNDWHRLCVEYPAEGNVGRSARNEPDFSRDQSKLAPDWSQVARDWDAVHLSFGGYLTAEQVRTESEHGWTYHWAWEHEQTLWLRWMFMRTERLDDYLGGETSRPHFEYSLFFAAMEAAGQA